MFINMRLWEAECSYYGVACFLGQTYDYPEDYPNFVSFYLSSDSGWRDGLSGSTVFVVLTFTPDTLSLSASSPLSKSKNYIKVEL